MDILTTEQIDELEAVQLTNEEILMLRLRSTTSVNDIAALLGLSRQWVSKLIKDAYDKIEAQRTLRN